MPAPPWLVLPHASDEQSAALGRPSALVPLRDRAGVTQGPIDGSRRTDGGHDRAGGRPALEPASDPDARPPTRWDRAGSRRSAYAYRPGTSPKVRGTRRRFGGRATSGHSTRSSMFVTSAAHGRPSRSRRRGSWANTSWTARRIASRQEEQRNRSSGERAPCAAGGPTAIRHILRASRAARGRCQIRRRVPCTRDGGPNGLASAGSSAGVTVVPCPSTVHR